MKPPRFDMSWGGFFESSNHCPVKTLFRFVGALLCKIDSVILVLILWAMITRNNNQKGYTLLVVVANNIN